MLARTATVVKWTLFCLAGVFFMVLQNLFLNRITILGVIPFLYPLIVAVPATMEGSLFGSAYGLILGIFCDLLLPVPIPCFFVLIFPFVGFCAGLLSRNLLPVGLLCSLLAAIAAFLLTDLFHILILWAQNKLVLQAAAWITLREFCVSVPLILILTPLYSLISRYIHRDD